jgi:hypothetical protein
VDSVYCWFVIPGIVGLLLWWAAGDWFAGLWFFAPPAFLGSALFLSVMAGTGFRFLRCCWPQPKPMPWWQWPLWAIPPILMAAWIWIERHDELPGLWIDRTLWRSSLFFELDARLAVGGVVEGGLSHLVPRGPGGDRRASAHGRTAAGRAGSG